LVTIVGRSFSTIDLTAERLANKLNTETEDLNT
jgi:hypothetical protein